MMTMTNHAIPNQSTSGYVLIVVLIFLLSIGFVGSSTFFSSFSESKKSYNFSTSSEAFQNAESALREAEFFILNQATRPSIVAPATSVTTGFPVYDPKALSKEVVETGRQWPQETMPWWRTYGSATSSSIEGLEEPLVILEEVGFQPDSAAVNNQYGTSTPGVMYYQVSARSKGHGASTATLQSITAKRFN